MESKWVRHWQVDGVLHLFPHVHSSGCHGKHKDKYKISLASSENSKITSRVEYVLSLIGKHLASLAYVNCCVMSSVLTLAVSVSVTPHLNYAATTCPH